MTSPRSTPERLIELIAELALLAVRRDETGGDAPRRVSTVLGELRELLRKVASDVRAAGPAASEDIAQVVENAAAALDAESGGVPDLDKIGAHLKDLVEIFTGERARQEAETTARIRQSAERSIADALRKVGLKPLGSKE